MSDQVKLYVSGMSCQGCVRSVRAILSRNLSVDESDVAVDLEGGTAIVKMPAGAGADEDKLAETLFELKREGFPAQQFAPK